jgi:CheY-like chemotaxis protein
MNGEIRLNSSVDEGSEFQVLLVSAALPKMEEAVSREDILAPKIHSAGGKKLPDILIVEDNLVNIQLLMIYIRRFCNIYTTLDAKAAIELTRERKFDAILMDINLGPGMDGIQAMLEIRKRPDYHDTPILAVTGYASIGDRERLITIGFDGYIPKPYDKVTIAAMMMELFPG